MDQVCFTGESLCQSFAGHTLKANMCTRCMKDVAKHKKETVTEDELVKVRIDEAFPVRTRRCFDIHTTLF